MDREKFSRSRIKLLSKYIITLVLEQVKEETMTESLFDNEIFSPIKWISIFESPSWFSDIPPSLNANTKQTQSQKKIFCMHCFPDQEFRWLIKIFLALFSFKFGSWISQFTAEKIILTKTVNFVYAENSEFIKESIGFYYYARIVMKRICEKALTF